MSKKSEDMEMRQVVRVSKAILDELKRKDIMPHISMAAISMTLVDLAILDNADREDMALFMMNTFQMYETYLTFGMPQKN